MLVEVIELCLFEELELCSFIRMFLKIKIKTDIKIVYIYTYTKRQFYEILII